MCIFVFAIVFINAYAFMHILTNGLQMTKKQITKLGRRPKLVEGSPLWQTVRQQIVDCELTLAEICEKHNVSRSALHTAFPGLRLRSYQKARAGK